MIIENANVYQLEQGFITGNVVIRDGKFETISTDSITPNKGEEVLDANGDFLIPGLVDIHFHGAVGEDFSDATFEGLQKIGAYEASVGVTSICPASMTLSEETLTDVCENAYVYTQTGRTDKMSKLCGIHLEGPFISEKKMGAQNPLYRMDPDVDMFMRLQDAAKGLVKLITIAPETKGAIKFIDRLHDKVHVSLGHTACDYDEAMTAFSHGADHVTHFYNAMTPFSHRNPGVIGAALDTILQEEAEPDGREYFFEMICDGIHLHSAAVHTAFRLYGAEHMVLISDTMRAVGLQDGMYTLGGLPVKVTGHLAALEDGTIAGSATNLMDCLKKAVEIGIPLEDAIRCATINPAKAIGVDDTCGRIAVGRAADCVLMDQNSLEVKRVYLDGIQI